MRGQGNCGVLRYAAPAICAGLAGALVSGVYQVISGNKTIVVAFAVLLFVCAMASLALGIRQAGRQ